MLAVSALLVTLPAAYPSAEAGAADCPWCQAKPPSKPVIFACQNRPRSKCEWSIGQQYLSIGFFAEAKEHCGKALQIAHSFAPARSCLEQAQASIDSQRHARFASRLTYIAQLIDDKDLDKAESELKALRAYEADEDKKFGPLKDEDVRWLDSVAGRLASESVWPWDIKQFDSHFLKLPPGVARQIWRIQAFLGFLIAAFAAFWIARWICQDCLVELRPLDGDHGGRRWEETCGWGLNGCTQRDSQSAVSATGDLIVSCRASFDHKPQVRTVKPQRPIFRGLARLSNQRQAIQYKR